MLAVGDFLISHQTWVSGFLLVFNVLGGIAVARGIIMEASEHPTPRQLLGARFVIGGVVVETAFTFLLFGYDQIVSHSQQNSIVAILGKNKDLETALDDQGKKITAANNRLADISDRTTDLQDSLNEVSDKEASLSNGQSGLARKQVVLARRQLGSEKRLSGAEQRIADVTDESKRAAQSLAVAKKEQRAFEEDEKSRRPRVISLVRLQIHRDELRTFTGMQVYIAAWPGSESEGLADQIFGILKGYGWDARRVDPNIWLAEEGVLVKHADIPISKFALGLSDEDTKRARAARAICRMLNDQSIAAKAESEIAAGNAKPDEVSWEWPYPPQSVLVLVGAKPGTYNRDLEPPPPGFPAPPAYVPENPCEENASWDNSFFKQKR